MSSLLDKARDLDSRDPLGPLRGAFTFPRTPDGKPCTYLTGNSLGLAPKGAREALLTELEDWEALGVEGHLEARNPWYSYHEALMAPLARLAGAKPAEVVPMGSLTANLHLLLSAFYRPEGIRRKVLMIGRAFPSDRYAVESQIRFHGGDPAKDLLEHFPPSGQELVEEGALRELIERRGSEIAVVLWEQPHYLTGQAVDVEALVAAAHRQGCVVGLDLAHGMGNLALELNRWGVDFAVWCSYKYLNGGPGSIAGLFVHERHHRGVPPAFWGWWGTDKGKRFQMSPQFEGMTGAEGWQLSNPSIFPLAVLRSSLALFERCSVADREAKRRALTQGFLELCAPLEGLQVVTPREPERRGAQISLKIPGATAEWVRALRSEGIFCDFRQPDVFRVAFAPLYCSHEDVVRVFKALETRLKGTR